MTLFGVNGQMHQLRYHVCPLPLLLAYHNMTTHTPLVAGIQLLGNGQQILGMCSFIQYTARTLHIPGTFSLIPGHSQSSMLHADKYTTPHFSTHNIENSAVAWG